MLPALKGVIGRSGRVTEEAVSKTLSGGELCGEISATTMEEGIIDIDQGSMLVVVTLQQQDKNANKWVGNETQETTIDGEGLKEHDGEHGIVGCCDMNDGPNIIIPIIQPPFDKMESEAHMNSLRGLEQFGTKLEIYEPTLLIEPFTSGGPGSFSKRSRNNKIGAKLSRSGRGMKLRNIGENKQGCGGK
ncbi:hypothetical protein LWI28_016937 [Acer negundo]|uniref:Uncharacterized protein n=1 Tax=Acer negundo TaxID=4023 RepID=A0AAD5IR54_ACENE|nr:hypothetical protein LWI28_016937 [Acer negundo]KAK4843821.1 hypothetical protein QYF36_013070 [Acer negundo]